jgi:hypothetical protein
VFGDTSWSVGYWLELTGTPDSGDLVDLATDVYGAFETTLLVPQSTGSHLTECAIEYFTGVGSMSVASFANHAGGDDSGGLPANLACVVSWGIVDTYRGGKPRTYLPGMSQGNEASVRTWDDDFVTAVSAAGAAFITAVNGITTTNLTSVSLGTLHFFSGGVALDPPTFDPYLTASAQKRICTQRRRLGREI